MIVQTLKMKMKMKMKMLSYCSVAQRSVAKTKGWEGESTPRHATVEREREREREIEVQRILHNTVIVSCTVYCVQGRKEGRLALKNNK
jgi:hypothetical protein